MYKLVFKKDENDYLVNLVSVKKPSHVILSFVFSENGDKPDFKTDLIKLASHIEQDRNEDNTFNLEVEPLNEEQENNIIFKTLYTVFTKFVESFKTQYKKTRDKLEKEFLNWEKNNN
ncbi:hypothetical protein H3143_01235 [Mycoplasma tullyi]|uniref:Uncharacterized protein n=1 Tax=Mycoplasma tullyi TaxID=1612150 RepID=A0A7D7YM26_9MOLU|nr:hypothetical protein [Mycoplasma tullyi]QMT98742.1 hypothetical protein H3143_01235 [Mycoplasma tullyi]